MQHQAIQQKLKAVAEELGYRVTIEKGELDGKGSIDLVMERQEEGIACKINVTSTIDYEVGNVGWEKSGHLQCRCIVAANLPEPALNPTNLDPCSATFPAPDHRPGREPNPSRYWRGDIADAFNEIMEMQERLARIFHSFLARWVLGGFWAACAGFLGDSAVTAAL